MADNSVGRRELRIAGFGGQGVVLSGSIVGKAASIYDKGFAALTQSYGPEARGGSCTAEVVMSHEPIDYPYVTDPEVTIILAQEAYLNYGRNLPPGTLVIMDPDLVTSDPSQEPVPLSIPATRLAREMGRVVVANIIMLGFLAAVSDLLPPQALRNAVEASVPQGTEEFNLKAFDLGYTYGLEHGGRGSGATG
ncbi:MAG: 2-oxoacid:acceptor oxidoreductase family protein [Chloroflexi bacterium]|nr:2-oxoacid:acceptor oxidoreductase family protein [Chloroflexota bacterium]